MLWSLFKIILFVVLIAALALGAGQLLELEGGVRVAIAGWELSLSPLQAVLAVVFLLCAVWFLLKIVGLLVAVVRFVVGDETAINRYFNRNRERKGFQALADGLMALASGEGRTAMSKAAKAEKYLRRPELTNLVTAQAAEMTGDKRKAQAVYKELLKDDRTRFVGVRGIMKQKLAEGDTDTALKLAERAFALKPKHEETQDVLLRLQAGQADWKGARATLGAKLKHGSLPRDVHKRRDAVLALSEAKDVLAAGSTIEAREAAIEANRLSPDLVPAAVMAARSYADEGKPKYAVRVIKKAWESQPHPDLAAAFAALEPEEDAQSRLKRFKQLLKLKPDHIETKLLQAELNIAAEDFPEARRSLGDLIDDNPNARVLTIMAAIERGEGKPDSVVRGWLTRALTASRGPQWVCGNCHTVHAEWEPVCSNCQAFDTLAWTEPSGGDISMPGGVEMLPMLVGAPESTEVVAVEEFSDEPTESAKIENSNNEKDVLDAEIVEGSADQAGQK